MPVLPILNTTIESSWYNALKDEFTKDYFIQLSNFIKKEIEHTPILPDISHIFYWSHLTPVNSVKVVIIGQDPYHNEKVVPHGLCFSINRYIDASKIMTGSTFGNAGVAIGTTPVKCKFPPSLDNIFKELADDIPEFNVPSHGNLSKWAKQGILLLNAVLTVRKGSANSHKDKGWEIFTDKVISVINETCDGVVFMLWGAHAQKKASLINDEKHHILKTSHPSPLSYENGFKGCKHFSRCNEILRRLGKTPINWQI